MDITKDANETQLWSVIPYAVATPATVIVAFLSDHMQLRGVVMLFTLPVAIVGYAVIANVASAHVRFAMTCLMATGMYSSVPCVLGWNANNSAGHYKRATTSALQLMVANAGGFVASESVHPVIRGRGKGRRASWCCVLTHTTFCNSVRLPQLRWADLS